MIIIEAIIEVIRWLARCIFWLITARDCDHCKYHGGCQYTNPGFEGWDMYHDCKNSVTRVNFVRKKKDGEGNG